MGRSGAARCAIHGEKETSKHLETLEIESKGIQNKEKRCVTSSTDRLKPNTRFKNFPRSAVRRGTVFARTSRYNVIPSIRKTNVVISEEVQRRSTSVIQNIAKLRKGNTHGVVYDAVDVSGSKPARTWLEIEWTAKKDGRVGRRC